MSECDVNHLGIKIWREQGVIHRDAGPAVTYPDGQELWFFRGELHRVDGPAIIYPDGRKFWYWRGWRVDSLTHLILRYRRDE